MSRIVEYINDSWEFHFGDKQAGEGVWERVSIPHCWNSEDLPNAGTRPVLQAVEKDSNFAGYGTGEGDDYYRGVCWYRRTLKGLSKATDKRHTLRFEGANQDAIVFFNGEEIARHNGGYTAFNVALPEHLFSGAEEDLLEVRLSNANNEALPPIGGDLGHFGGIYRDVKWIQSAPIHFDFDFYGSLGVSWRTPYVSAEKADFEFTARVAQAEACDTALLCEVLVSSPSGQHCTTLSQAVVFDADARVSVLHYAGSVDAPELWSPETPNLYQAEFRLKAAEQWRNTRCRAHAARVSVFRIRCRARLLVKRCSICYARRRKASGL